MNARVLLLLASLTLGGCALSPFASDASTARVCPTPSQEQQLALNLAQEMAEQGRRHAALAHLQQLPAQLPAVQLGQARLLRDLDPAKAKTIYTGLLGSCLDGQAEHGLGQLAVAAGQLPVAYTHLQRARQRVPTDAQVRSDLGLVLMGMNQPEAARFEFTTALELEPRNVQPAVNLLALLFFQGRDQQAAHMATQWQLNATQVRDAQTMARRLRALSSAESVPLAGR